MIENGLATSSYKGCWDHFNRKLITVLWRSWKRIRYWKCCEGLLKKTKWSFRGFAISCSLYACTVCCDKLVVWIKGRFLTAIKRMKSCILYQQQWWWIPNGVILFKRVTLCLTSNSLKLDVFIEKYFVFLLHMSIEKTFIISLTNELLWILWSLAFKVNRCWCKS